MLGWVPPWGPRFSLPHAGSVPSRLPASVSPPQPGWQSQDGAGGRMPRGRHGRSGCPRAGKVPGFRKRRSHRDPPAPKNRKHQTCSGSSSRGMHPRSGHPRASLGWGSRADRPPPTLPARLRPDKLIALSRPREGAAAPGSERPPCLGTVGENRGRRQAASPAAPGAGPILHPGDASRRSAGAALPGCRCWRRWLGRARRGSSPMPAG